MHMFIAVPFCQKIHTNVLRSYLPSALRAFSFSKGFSASFIHRCTHWLMWEDGSGDPLVCPLCSNKAPHSCDQLGFEYLQDWRLYNLSRQLILMFNHPHCKKKKKGFLMFVWNFVYFICIPFLLNFCFLRFISSCISTCVQYIFSQQCLKLIELYVSCPSAVMMDFTFKTR